MSSFETTKKKIKETNSQQIDNSNLIDNKTNDLKKINVDNLYINSSKVLFDTGNKVLEAGTIPFYNGDLNQMLPVFYGYWHEANNVYNIPENFIPFVDIQNSFVLPSDEQLITSYEVEIDKWDYDYIEVAGDSQQIWTGYRPPYRHPQNNSGTDSSLFTINQSRIDDGSVLSSHTKLHWKTSIEYTVSGIQYRIVNGTFFGLISNFYNVSSPPCGTQNNLSFMMSSVWYQTGAFSGLTNCEVLSCVGSSITIKGGEFHYYSTGTEETCTRHQDLNLNITKSFNVLSDLSSITIYGKREQKIGGVWTFVGNYNYYIISPSLGHTITNFESIEENFLCYYDTNKRFLFTCVNNIGSLPTLTLPVKTDYEGLPYTSIIIKSNNGDTPRLISERLGYIPRYFYGDLYSSEPFWVRTSKTTDAQEAWMLKFYFTSYKLTKATKVNNTTYIVLNRTYIHNGTHDAYVIGTNVQSNKIKKRYNPIAENTIFARVIGYIKSNFYWKQTKSFTQEVS